MPTTTLEDITFTSTRLVNVPCIMEYRTLLEYSCYPPPNGSRPLLETFEDQTIGPTLLQDSVDPGELTRVVQGTLPTGTAANLSDILARVEGPLGLGKVTISPGNIPPSAKRPVPCFKTTIALEIVCDIVEIVATARIPLNLFGVNYAAGGTVATFRVKNPVGSRLKRLGPPSEDRRAASLPTTAAASRKRRASIRAFSSRSASPA